MISLVFNLIMAIVDGLFFFYVHKNASWKSALRGIFIGFLTGLLLSMALGEDSFGRMRLFSYHVFLHGTIIFLGTGFLMRKKSPKGATVCFIFFLVVIMIGIDAFLIEPHWLKITRLNLRFSKSILKKPLKIIILADLQTDHIGEYEKKVFQTLMDEKADLILLAGDYVQEENREHRKKVYKSLRNILQKIHFSAPLGIFAVKGNVDSKDWMEIFESFPVKMFSSLQTIQAGSLQITGMSKRDSFDTNLEIFNSSNKFHIVLGHAPDFSLGKIQGNLLIAGHVHGGQVRIPWIGPLITLSQVPRSWSSGLTKLDSSKYLLVSRGIGMERAYAPRMRFFCRPELVIINLIPGE